MDNELYRKLVDLYAGRELPNELEDQMSLNAFSNIELNHDMSTLRRTVDLLRDQQGVEYTEESHQRILMKLYARGADIMPKTKEPAHLQYHLPIHG